jgi:hypothetical protein
MSSLPMNRHQIYPGERKSPPDRSWGLEPLNQDFLMPISSDSEILICHNSNFSRFVKIS